MAGRFRTRAGGLRLFTVTPSLNPSPRGRDSAAEATVRLAAQSLRPERCFDSKLVQCRVFVLPPRFGTRTFASACKSGSCRVRRAEPPFLNGGFGTIDFVNH